MLPNFFSHIDKHGRIPTVFRPRLRNITKFYRMDIANNDGSSSGPGSGKMASPGTMKVLHSHFYIPDIYSPLGNSCGLGRSSALLRFFSERRCLTPITIPNVMSLNYSKTNGHPGQNA